MTKRNAGQANGKNGKGVTLGSEQTPLRQAAQTGPISPGSSPLTREFSLLLAVWLVLSFGLTVFVLRDLSSPGLYYDEAIFAGLAKDFVNGFAAGPHMPNTTVVSLFGRPFPLFVQDYLGGLKSWLVIPSFTVFGSNLSVLRITSLFWSLVALLFFMLWTRKLLGLPAALVAGPLIGLDPSFFFLSVFDWGAVVPSFLCRSSGCYFFLLWSRRRRWRDGLLAAVLLSLGVFNKIDFAVLLVGCGVALFVTYRQSVVAALRDSRRQIAVCGLAFFLVAGPMAFFLFNILEEASAIGGQPGAFTEKLNTLRAMYDGSYFFRLIEVGGKFDRMFAAPAGVWSPFGLAVIVAAVVLAVHAVRTGGVTQEGRVAAFLLLSLVLVTIGVLMLPGAVRMHHSTLVYPFPHLILAAFVVILWKTPAAGSFVRWGLRAVAAAILCLVMAGHLHALLETQSFFQTTGGRGWWSNSIEAFCNDVKNQPGLPIISVDWGFNEQLCFLTEGKQLSEPFWSRQPLSLSDKAIYLVHPREYALFPQGMGVLDFLRRNAIPEDSVRPYTDRQGNVAFYAIHFAPRKP